MRESPCSLILYLVSREPVTCSKNSQIRQSFGDISNLSAVGGGVASCCELHAAAGLALHLQLDQAEVVACTSAMWSTSNISIKVMGFTSGIFTTNLFQRHPWPACQCRSRMGVPCLCKMIMCENHPLPAHFRFSFMESNDCL